ncbi:hypothetical protein SFR_1959 [Streptomyces sp. FR-008]|nr:hypothetical protein SFR_1959 [Streptomyces sp. FR-008]
MTSGDITAWSPPADARTVRPAPTATTRGEAPGESEPKGHVVVETPVARRERSERARRASRQRLWRPGGERTTIKRER